MKDKKFQRVILIAWIMSIPLQSGMLSQLAAAIILFFQITVIYPQTNAAQQAWALPYKNIAQ